MKLVIGRTSASRPDLLKRSTESLFSKIRFSGEIIHVLNEDVVNYDKSQEVLFWAHSSNLFQKIFVNNPSTYQSSGIIRMLNFANNIDAKYYFNFEDDWLIDREINLDLIIELMENNFGINQIAFHKRSPGQRSDFKKWELIIDNINLITNLHWTLIPAIWRMDFCKRFLDIHIAPTNNASWAFNKILKKEIKLAHWVIGNIGSYFYGKLNDINSKFVTHIGEEISRRTL